MTLQKRISLIVTFFLLILTPSAFADESPQNPEDEGKHLYADVDLYSKVDYQYGNKPKYFIKTIFPQLESDEEDSKIDDFNQIVKTMMRDETNEFKKQVMQNHVAQQKMPTEEINNRLYIDHNTAFTQAGSQHLLSVRFNVKSDITGMAHPYNTHRVVNFNLDRGEKIKLADLFAPESHYLEFLSTYCNHMLSRKLANKQMIADGTAPNENNFRNWNIKPNGLLITFDVYQVAPYVSGAQTVLVPFALLKPLLAQDSVIAPCVKSASSCMAHHLLTGGFIDEALNASHGRLDPIFG